MTADLRIEGDFTIVAASHQRDEWLGWLTETAGADMAAWPCVGLDLSAVDGFDSAGVQLLLSLKHSLHQRGQRLQLLGSPPAVTDALQRYGLHSHLITTAAAAEAAAA